MLAVALWIVFSSLYGQLEMLEQDGADPQSKEMRDVDLCFRSELCL